MRYYSDERITYDEGEEIVKRFIQEHSQYRSRITSKDVARAMDIDERQHNLIRIHDALQEHCEIIKRSSTKATRFKI